MSTRQFADLPAADPKEPNTVTSRNAKPRRARTTGTAHFVNKVCPERLVQVCLRTLRAQEAREAAAAQKAEAA